MTYKFEKLPNGLIRVDCRSTGLVALFNPDGTHRSGPLRSVTPLVLHWLEAHPC